MQFPSESTMARERRKKIKMYTVKNQTQDLYLLIKRTYAKRCAAVKMHGQD